MRNSELKMQKVEVVYSAFRIRHSAFDMGGYSD